MSRLLFEARAAVLASEAQQALIEKEIELEKLKQQRKPLTDEEIKTMWRCSKIYGTNEEKALALARAIEAALGITGEQK